MLTPGNRKLGGNLIWGFGLPSGTKEVCVGMTPACRSHCYAVRFARYRTAAQALYQRNLELTRLSDFAMRMRYFILNNDVRVVRIHTGGDFYSARYARLWLKIICWLPAVQFYSYTRSWRIPAIREALQQIAQRANARLWYSCDRDTGFPQTVPDQVKVCWLMTSADDVPSQPVDLVFRIQRLRKIPLPSLRVCPDENGKAYTIAPHCDSCGYCWRSVSSPTSSHSNFNREVSCSN